MEKTGKFISKCRKEAGLTQAVLEQDSGYCECQNCKHKYIPSAKAVIFAVHSGSDRILRCPECSKKIWHKKVLTR